MAALKRDDIFPKDVIPVISAGVAGIINAPCNPYAAAYNLHLVIWHN